MRTLLKTASFACLHFGVGFSVAYVLTGQVGLSIGVALIEPAVNTIVFYFHERVWSGKGMRFRGPHDMAASV